MTRRSARDGDLDGPRAPRSAEGVLGDRLLRRARPASTAGGEPRRGGRRSRSRGRRWRWRGRRRSRRSWPTASTSRPSATASGLSGSGTAPWPTRLSAKRAYQPRTMSEPDSSSRRAAARSPPSAASPSHSCEHGVAGEAQPHHAGDERRHLRHRQRLGAALGQVAAEGVVEPAGRRRGLGGLLHRRPRRGPARVAAAQAVGHRAGEVADAVGVGRRQRPAQRGAGAAGPQQRARPRG